VLKFLLVLTSDDVSHKIDEIVKDLNPKTTYVVSIFASDRCYFWIFWATTT